MTRRWPWEQQPAIRKELERGIVADERKPLSQMPVYRQRYNAVISLVRRVQPKKVVDMGCGGCKLLQLIKAERCVRMLIGVDVNRDVLEQNKHLVEPDLSDYFVRRPQPLRVALYIQWIDSIS